MILRLIAGLALLLPVGAHAQTVLTPGHPDLTAAAPQSYEYVVQIAGTTPRRLGTATRSETLAGDRLVVAERLTIAARNQDQRDTTVVTWPGLVPVSRASHSGEEHTRMTYAGGRMAGRRVLGNLDEPVDAALPEGVFADGASSMIARMVPLREGYSATFRMVDASGDAATSTVTVGAAADGVWRVTVAVPDDVTVTYAIDGATREVRRFSFSPQPDLTIEMVPPPPPPTTGVMRPGDPSLDTAWLPGDAATYTVRLVEPQQMDLGTRTITRTVGGGVVTTVITTISVPQQGINTTQTSRAAVGTLAPVSESMTGRDEAELAFTPTAVTGIRVGAPVSVTLDAPVFDASWSDEIAQSLPFADGYTTAIAAYDAANGIVTIRYTVKGQQTVSGVATWEVETVSPTGIATYFIDAETRALVMARVSPQTGVVVEMTRQP